MQLFGRRCARATALTLVLLLCSHASFATIDPVLAQHWAAYLDAVAQAKARVEQAPIVQGELDLADADAFVDAIRDYAMRFALTNDPARPIFVQDPTRASAGIGLANPDNIYYEAVIGDQYDYRIYGTRGSNADLSFQVFAGVPGNGVLQDTLLLRDMKIAENGSFTISVSATAPASGNWLRLGPGANNILVRQTFNDWSRERRGTLRIERTGSASSTSAAALGPLMVGPRIDAFGAASVSGFDVATLQAPSIHPIRPRGAKLPLLTIAEAAAAVDFVTGQIVEQVDFYYPYATNVFPALGTNTVTSPRPTADGLTGQLSSVGVFNLDTEHALIVTLKPSDAPYQGFEINNSWLIPFDYLRPMSLTTRQAEVDPDGRIRYVISLADPGVPNWLDPTGRTHGIIFLRWQGLTHPLAADEWPGAEVVPLADLQQHLPTTTPIVDAMDRERRLRDRARELTTRFSGADPARALLELRIKQLQRLLGLDTPPFQL